MITYKYRSIRDKKLSMPEEFKTGALVIAEEPTVDELKYLESRFKFDASLLTDALDSDEIPRG